MYASVGNSFPCNAIEAIHRCGVDFVESTGMGNDEWEFYCTGKLFRHVWETLHFLPDWINVNSRWRSKPNQEKYPRLVSRSHCWFARLPFMLHQWVWNCPYGSYAWFMKVNASIVSTSAERDWNGVMSKSFNTQMKSYATWAINSDLIFSICRKTKTDIFHWKIMSISKKSDRSLND